MTMMVMETKKFEDRTNKIPENAPKNGALAGMGAMMEVAGIESIPNLDVAPKMVGFSYSDD